MAGARCISKVLPGWVLLGLLIASCGSPSSASNDAAQTPSSTVQLFPATTVSARPISGDAVPQGPVFVDPAERCPTSIGPPSGDGGQGMVAESGRLEAMLGQVLAYGSEHRDEFGTYGLVWHSGSDASVLISFTGNLDAHRAALAKLVEHPDELMVCQAALSGDANLALQTVLGTELAGRFSSIGQGFGAVFVKLPATEENVAAELAARYGDIVSVTVGNFAYPLAPDAHPDGSQCAASVSGPSDLNGLRATLELLKPTFGVADEISGTVTITNTGDQPSTFSSGSPLVALIVDPGTTKVVGTYDREIAGVGDGATLQPGESHTIPVVASTASCDPRLGFALPPGEYEAIVPVVVTYPQLEGKSPINQLVSGVATLTLAP